MCVHEAFCRGLHEGRAARVGHVGVRAAAEQRRGALAEALGGGVDQRRVAVVVRGVDEVREASKPKRDGIKSISLNLIISNLT